MFVDVIIISRTICHATVTKNLTKRKLTCETCIIVADIRTKENRICAEISEITHYDSLPLLLTGDDT